MKNLLKNNLIKNYMILVVFFSLLEISFRLISGISLNNIALLRIFIGVNFVSILLSFILSWFNKLISKILDKHNILYDSSNLGKEALDRIRKDISSFSIFCPKCIYIFSNWF